MTRAQHSHTHSGVAQGAFARHVSLCRELVASSGAEDVLRSLEETTFHLVDYHNYSKDKALPLFRSRIFDSVIRGQWLELFWVEVECHKVDLSHTRGDAHWERVTLKKCNVDRLLAKVVARGSTFESCRFWDSLLEDCVFERCTFTRCDFRGSRFRRASFVDCRFADVDLARVTWEDTVSFQITGDWHGAPMPLPSGPTGYSAPDGVTSKDFDDSG